MAENDVNEDLLDYEEEETAEGAAGDAAKETNGVKTKKVCMSIFPVLCIRIPFMKRNRNGSG